MKIIKKLLFYHQMRYWDRLFYRRNGKDCFVPPPSRVVQFFVDNKKHPDEEKLKHNLKIYAEIQQTWNDKKEKDRKQLEIMIDSLDDYEKGWELLRKIK
ncbi:MAG: hypothetical protein IJ733_08375 [Lachnospiraceae bacterium]|nr:hypothetical protein [Lachnospiraceae bacterium]